MPGYLLTLSNQVSLENKTVETNEIFRLLGILELNTRVLVFCESPLLGECPTTGTEERWFLAVVPDK